MKKGVIKKIVNKSLKIVVPLVLAVGILIPGSIYASSNFVENKDNFQQNNNENQFNDVVYEEVVEEETSKVEYASTEQILRLIKDLNLDQSYVKLTKYNTIIRMAHNGDEPVYVTISDEFSAEDKEIIKQCLDSIFEDLQIVNKYYRMQVVENSSPDKSTIIFEKTSLANIEAAGLASVGRIEEGLGKENLIQLDDKLFQNFTLQQKKYTVNHEILHLLGREDAYYCNNLNSDSFGGNSAYKGTYKYDTIMGENKSDYLTVDDFKLLLAVNAEKVETQEEYNQLLQTINYEAEKYKAEIENYHADFFNENITSPITEFPDSFAFKTFDFMGSKKEYYVEVQNGEYQMFAQDKKGEEILINSGQAEVVNGVMILRDVKIKNVEKYNVKFDFDGEMIISARELPRGLTLYVGDSIHAGYSLSSIIELENSLEAGV